MLGKFFAIAFAFTWSLQLPGVLARLGVLHGDGYLGLAMLGVFGPMVAALTLDRRGSWDALTRWRVAPRWYAIALLLPGALLAAGMALLHHAGHPGRWLFLPSVPDLIAACVIALAEETGWRGFVLPRLQARWGAVGASGVLGVVWMSWHLPMFVAVGVPLSTLPVMTLYFVGGSLFFTWIWNGTGGSSLLAVLAHVGAHLNNSHRALPGDALPLLVHAIVYALLGLAVMQGTLRPRALTRS